METLPFCPQPGYSVESEPRRLVSQFGDGYVQRKVDGLNPLLRKFSLSFNIRHNQAKELSRFFSRHGGVKAFRFRERVDDVFIKVICPKWSITVNKSHTQFNCEFEEVI